jgi:hypothetical protein
MKYLILATRDGVKIPIIFPEFVEHADVAKAFLDVLDDLVQVSSMGRLSLNDVSIDDQDSMADALEILSHDYFNTHEMPDSAAN